MSQLAEIESVGDVESCFAATFDTYDSWLQSRAAENHHFNEGSFKEQIPRQDYVRYSDRLDCAFFEYEVDGLTIGGFLVVPRGAADLPVILFNRGGTAEYGRMDFAGLFLNVFWLADAGYAVIGTQYRGGMGLPAEIGGTDEWGGSDVRDVLALVPIAQALEVADAERLGMFAGSRGAVNMFRASLELEVLKAMVSVSGAYDLAREAQLRPRMERIYREYIPGFEENRELVLAQRSVVEWVDRLDLNVPILLLHGTYDERASAMGALRFARLLQERWHPYRLVMFENDDHFLSDHQKEMREIVTEWFARYLR
ncbi:MAG: prolyl oligopeptidase family serine peptidase [Gammaproteobacteria bacterium]|nr:prolyl oligopeptidase family serine peptidase [Gammaproteobacteria bacterium]